MTKRYHLKTYEKLFAEIVDGQGNIIPERLNDLSEGDKDKMILRAVNGLKKRSDRRSEAMSGRELSEDHKRKIGEALKGNQNGKRDD